MLALLIGLLFILIIGIILFFEDKYPGAIMIVAITIFMLFAAYVIGLGLLGHN